MAEPVKSCAMTELILESDIDTVKASNVDAARRVTLLPVKSKTMADVSMLLEFLEENDCIGSLNRSRITSLSELVNNRKTSDIDIIFFLRLEGAGLDDQLIEIFERMRGQSSSGGNSGDVVGLTEILEATDLLGESNNGGNIDDGGHSSITTQTGDFDQQSLTQIVIHLPADTEGQGGNDTDNGNQAGDNGNAAGAPGNHQNSVGVPAGNGNCQPQEPQNDRSATSTLNGENISQPSSTWAYSGTTNSPGGNPQIS